MVARDQPFAVGRPSIGHMTDAGFEACCWEARVVAIGPMIRFACEWPTVGGDEVLMDNDVPEWTLCEFVLEPFARAISNPMELPDDSEIA